ncbi:DUF7283 family protein [Haladaptatus pallidirubidus]|uniref:Secreted protein n=1 Tax=Haladaptatus pallidirubidus TaxID=1008152 RepID=A0AAV3UL93_9EURY|nr:hypothetical protein [Haladaptatus pallidirubidus]
MFDAPVDAWYVWLGVAIASLVVFGVAAELPTTPPPDATRAVNTVDSVAGCEYTATAEQPLSAREIKLDSRGLGLRGKGGTAHAAFVSDSVVPVGSVDGSKRDTRLRRVLNGTPPDVVFDSPTDFDSAIRDEQNHRAEWMGADSTLRIRCVSWGGVDATLVS